MVATHLRLPGCSFVVHNTGVAATQRRRRIRRTFIFLFKLIHMKRRGLTDVCVPAPSLFVVLQAPRRNVDDHDVRFKSIPMKRRLV